MKVRFIMSQDKILRMQDLAERAGVSVSTVSRVLSENGSTSPEIHDRVMKLVRKHGYRRLRRKPIRRQDGVRKSLQGRIALIASSELSCRLTDSSGIYTPILNGARSVTLEAGWDLMIDWAKHVDNAPLPESIRRGNVDGCLLVSAIPDGLLQRITQSAPAVLVNSRTSWVDVPCFLVDNCKMIIRCVQHLHEKGHRRIAYLNMYEQPESARSADLAYLLHRERRESFERAVERMGLCDDQTLWKPLPFFEDDKFTQLITEALADWLDRPKPVTAIVSPLSCTPFLFQEVARRGLTIPKDLSIVVLDDAPLAVSLHPRLTAVSSNHETTVKLAMECLMDAIAGKLIRSQTVLIEPKLIERDSVGPPPA